MKLMEIVSVLSLTSVGDPPALPGDRLLVEFMYGNPVLYLRGLAQSDVSISEFDGDMRRCSRKMREVQ